MLQPYIQILMEKVHLEKEQAEEAMLSILDETEPHQTAAFLALMKCQGETAEELLGMADALLKRCLPISFPFPVLDIAGTGGDFANTINISTGSAILAAACGIPVAKHGGRCVSSKSGSSDVLEQLGINIDLPPEVVKLHLQEAGITFMFAPTYHPSLKKISPIRRGLRFPTLFNLLCPVLNPAKAEFSVIGVAHESSLEILKEVIIHQSYRKRTLLFHGCGVDELTPLGKAIAYDIQPGKVERIEIDPIALGFSPCSLKDLQGGDAKCNAQILTNVFQGGKGAIADALILNAGAAAWVFGKASSLEMGVQLARNALENGGAHQVLNKWSQISKEYINE